MNRVAPVLAAVAACLLSVTGCTELSARREVQDGNALYLEGKYEEAVAKFESALGKAPDLQIAHHNAGLAHMKAYQPGLDDPKNLEHARRAVEHFEAYLAANPDDKKVVKVMIKTYVDSGNHAGAVAYYERLLADRPNDPEILLELAKINDDARQFDKALEWHRKRLALARDDSDKLSALFDIGNLQFRRLLNGKEIVGVERLRIADEGIAAFQQAMAIQPDNELFASMIAGLYEQRQFAHEVSWARTIEFSSVVIYRLKWKELFEKKQKQAQEAPPPAAAGGDGAGEEATGG